MRQGANLLEAALPCLACRHPAVERDCTGIRDRTATRRCEEDLRAGNCAAPKEICLLIFGVVLFVQHFCEPLDFWVVGRIFVQCADVPEDVGHLVDGIVAALGCTAVAGDALCLDADLHAAPLTTVDAAVRRLRRYDKCGAYLILLDDVLPAEAVTVLLLHRPRDEHGVLVREQSEILHDARAVDRRDDTAQLIGRPPPADLRRRFEALVGIELPVRAIADADGVDVAVKGDQCRAVPHVAEHVPHRIDLHLVEVERAHLLRDPVGVRLLPAALAGGTHDVPQELRHLRLVSLCCFLDAFIVQSHVILRPF